MITGIRYLEILAEGKCKLVYMDEDGLVIHRRRAIAKVADSIRAAFLVNPLTLPAGTKGRITEGGSIEWNNNAGLARPGRPRTGDWPLTNAEKCRAYQAKRKGKIQE